MLFDAATGKMIEPGHDFKVEDFVMKDSKGNYHLTTKSMAMAMKGANTGLPVTSGQNKEIYRGPGAPQGTATSDWEPINAADIANLRSLGYRI